MRIWMAGLVAGLGINAVDVPNSIVLGAPLLNAQLAAWGVASHPWMPAYMVALHFVLGIALAWLYELLREAGRRPFAAAAVSVVVLIGLNRLFAFGNVLIGTLPLRTFLAFSWAFVAGAVLGCTAAAALLERARTPRRASTTMAAAAMRGRDAG